MAMECSCCSDPPPVREPNLEAAGVRGFEPGGPAGRPVAEFAPWRLDDPRDLFSQSPVLVPETEVVGIEAIVGAVETVVSSASYHRAVGQRSYPMAEIDNGSAGVFFGYDFHIGEDGPRLIEINTNAGGALLSAHLASSLPPGCSSTGAGFGEGGSLASLEEAFVAMFHEEWRRGGAARPLQSVAIVDESPASQPMWREFMLFRDLFERHGLVAEIADPSDLAVHHQALWHGDTAIDLVYNRFCDFALGTSKASALAEAHRFGFAMVTPSPREHLLFADKRNLILLSDPELLSAWGVQAEIIDTLGKGVPRTVAVTPDNADELWRERKGLYFKPVAGYGSRGVYRGAKLTRRVWRNIVEGQYVAQEQVSPGTQQVEIDGESVRMKVDVRAYTYGGEILILAARTYRGQTTNMRTPGGGFAAVIHGRSP
jgi:hypothetical protein